MPTYEYQCQQCHERVEAVQKFTDAPLTTCPLCGGELRKVFSAVGIVFKGSGFYKNDSRGSSPTKTTSTSSTSSSAETKSTSAPAPAPAATPSSDASSSSSSSSSSSTKSTASSD